MRKVDDRRKMLFLHQKEPTMKNRHSLRYVAALFVAAAAVSCGDGQETMEKEGVETVL